MTDRKNIRRRVVDAPKLPPKPVVPRLVATPVIRKPPANPLPSWSEFTPEMKDELLRKLAVRFGFASE